MLLKKFLHYLDIRTLFQKSDQPKNMNLKFMHGMNRISILMFLVCLIVMLVRYLSR